MTSKSLALITFYILLNINEFWGYRVGSFRKSFHFSVYDSKASVAVELNEKVDISSNDENISPLVEADFYDSKLSLLLETMSEQEKYDILIQSYGANILETSDRNITVLKTMTSLFSEMLQKSIRPTEKASKSLIDAASRFGSCDKLGRALQLSKAGGIIRVYGVGIGKLVSPILKAENANLLPEVPKDNREKEVLYVGALASVVATYVGLQGLSVFDADLQNWATLLFAVTASIGLADITARQAQGVQSLISGLDRVLLQDSDRELHTDGAAFLTGYLLGLPCFPFRPDVTEALKLFLDHRPSMEVFRQAPLPLTGTPSPIPPIRVTASEGSGGTEGQTGLFQSIFAAFQPSTNSKSSAGGGSTLMVFSPPAPDVEYDVFGVGRILVWLMAPVAAEVLKYGKSISSDPRRPERFLKVLDELLKQKDGSETGTGTGLEGDNGSSGDTSRSVSGRARNLPRLPEPGPDRDALLRWAYNEATILVRQNADVLEKVAEFMKTGMTTVGECTILVEKELQG